jgi:hypothetical protein
VQDIPIELEEEMFKRKIPLELMIVLKLLILLCVQVWEKALMKMYLEIMSLPIHKSKMIVEELSNRLNKI